MNPNALAAAIDKARGKSSTETSQPASLAQAIAAVRAVRGTKPATDAPTPPKAAHRLAEGDGLPGLRQFMEDRRNGRR